MDYYTYVDISKTMLSIYPNANTSIIFGIEMELDYTNYIYIWKHIWTGTKFNQTTIVDIACNKQC